MATFQLEIITAERELYSGEVASVTAPGTGGQLTILPNHAPLLTQLDPGELIIRGDGEPNLLAVTGGFLEVLGNRVVVLADAAEQPDEIDIERAESALKRAQERLAHREEDIDFERAMRAVARSRARLGVARRRRRRASGAQEGARA